MLIGGFFYAAFSTLFKVFILVL